MEIGRTHLREIRKGAEETMARTLPPGAPASRHFKQGYIGPLGGAIATRPPHPGEELWIIARAPIEVEPEEAAPPTSPMLRAKRPNVPEEIPLPLKHTDVKASIAAYIASVRVISAAGFPDASVTLYRKL